MVIGNDNGDRKGVIWLMGNGDMWYTCWLPVCLLKWFVSFKFQCSLDYLWSSKSALDLFGFWNQKRDMKNSDLFAWCKTLSIVIAIGNNDGMRKDVIWLMGKTGMWYTHWQDWDVIYPLTRLGCDIPIDKAGMWYTHWWSVGLSKQFFFLFIHSIPVFNRLSAVSNMFSLNVTSPQRGRALGVMVHRGLLQQFAFCFLDPNLIPLKNPIKGFESYIFCIMKQFKTTSTKNIGATSGSREHNDLAAKT